MRTDLKAKQSKVCFPMLCIKSFVIFLRTSFDCLGTINLCMSIRTVC